MNDYESIISLANRLVKTPSQIDIDSPENILDIVASFFCDFGIEYKVIHNLDDNPVGIFAKILSAKSKAYKTYCLNACLDTAPFGDPEKWSFPPDSAQISNGWMYGRGTADSKIAVSIFLHIATLLKRCYANFSGGLYLYFDLDEHSGRFEGVKYFIDKLHYPINGFFVGYPGNRAIVIGARGFYRLKITVHGTSEHSGGKHSSGDNAIVKSFKVLNKILNISFVKESSDSDFSFGPRISVTAIKSGEGFSQIPDSSEFFIDVRLTEKNNKKIVETKILESMANYKENIKITYFDSWPAYKLDSKDFIVTEIRQNAETYFKKDIPLTICGPSNIGNYLASRNINAICGFGVTYQNIHATNECIKLNSIMPTFNTYLNTLKKLLA